MCLRSLVFGSLALALAGCAEKPPKGFATIEAECRAFTDPGFAVQGKRPQDRRWITTTQETGIGSCGWRRPPQEVPSAETPTTS